jgi:hypothetical protein
MQDEWDGVARTNVIAGLFIHDPFSKEAHGFSARVPTNRHTCVRHQSQFKNKKIK